MDSPTSDFDSNGDLDYSEPSTPSTPLEPFEPQYKVKVTEPVKDGDVVKYTVRTANKCGGDEEYIVVRQYEDFEYLHHLIITQNDVMGLVIPPLPIRPVTEAKGTENKSKQQYGSDSKILIGDEYHKDSRALEKYLRMMLAHYILGKDMSLDKFLKEKDPPVRAKIRKGLIGKLSDAVEEARKVNHKDIDDYFQKERIWAVRHAACIRHMHMTFSKMLFSQQKISSAYGHLATALNLGGGFTDEETTKANRLLVRFSEALQDAKHGSEVDTTNDDNTLGFSLDLYERYGEALKEMHYRRTCLLVDYQEANRNLSKAKPQKQQAAEDAKVEAEKAFENCSETARRELLNFHRQRLLSFEDALSLYAEAKIKTARDTNALLAKSLAQFKQMQL